MNTATIDPKPVPLAASLAPFMSKFAKETLDFVVGYGSCGGLARVADVWWFGTAVSLDELKEINVIGCWYSGNLQLGVLGLNTETAGWWAYFYCKVIPTCCHS